MSFAGHVFDMIGRIKYNQSLLKSIKARTKTIVEANPAVNKKHENHMLKFKEVSTEELEKDTEWIRKTMKRKRTLAFIKSMVITVIIGAVLGYLIINYFDFR